MTEIHAVRMGHWLLICARVRITARASDNSDTDALVEAQALVQCLARI